MKAKKILTAVLAGCMTLSLALAVGCNGEGAKGGDGICSLTGKVHVYENGICACGDGPVYPKSPSTITYVNPADKQNGGEAFNRFQCTEGYYELEIGEDGSVWVAFSVESAGQYALYSVENPNGTTAVQYDASAQYIPRDENGNYLGNPARTLDDGRFYSSINCSTQYYNAEWRATYAVYGNSGDTVRVRFVKIAEPQWTPSYVYETVYASEINGVKASEGGEGKQLQDVPYDSDYFYDETIGYYRMGTAENPGEIIYVAITKAASRLLQGGSFATINDEGNNLRLPNGTTADGDYLMYDYSKFIPNNGGDVNAEHDVTANCYENYVNSDGVYPVNKELYRFLTLYTQKNLPYELIEETDESILANAWLAPCYFYDELIQGTEDFPYTIGLGSFEITTKKRGYTYYTLRYDNSAAEFPTTVCNITTTHENAFLYVNGHSYKGAFNVNFRVTPSLGMTFYIGTVDGASETFTVTVSEVRGSQANPIEIVPSETAQSLPFTEVIDADGETVYEGYYVIKATESGTLYLSTTANVKILLDRDYLEKDAETGVTSGSTEVVLDEGETGKDIVVYISATDSLSAADVTVNFVPAA